MKRLYPAFRFLYESAFFEKVSLFFAMYVVTVSLFWFETGMLSKGLLFGLIAASLKTAIARGHARVFSPKCGPVASEVAICAECASPQGLDTNALLEADQSGHLPWVTAPCLQLPSVQSIPQ